MDRNNDKISENQLYSVLVILLIGTGILSLPRDLADKVGPDSLIIIIIGSLLFWGLAIIINKLLVKFPHSTIIEMGSSLVAKPIGKLLGFLYIIYLYLFLVLVTRGFGEITKSFLLLSTPIEIIIISFLLTSVYLVRSGIETIARVSVIILPLSLIPFLLTIFLVLNEVDPTYFLPVFRTPIIDLAKAIPEVMFSFIGCEFLLFIGYFVNDTKKIKREIYGALVTVGVIYSITIFIVIGRFGFKETRNLIWPTITLVKTINFPGTIIENIEIVIMSTWLLSIFATISITFFGVTFLTSRLINSKEHNYLAIPFIPLVYVASLIPENVEQVHEWTKMFAKILGTTFAIGIPVFLFIVSLFRKPPKREMKKNAE